MDDNKSPSDKPLYQPYLSQTFPQDFSRQHDYRSGSSESPVPDAPSGDDDDRTLLFQEPSQHVFQAGRPPDTERGLDRHQVKHRRSRKGCFTCRARKVKCDETRPVCVRCRKACKECKFPEENSSSSKDRRAAGHAREQSQDGQVPVEDESTPSLCHSKSNDSLGAPESTAPPPRSVPDEGFSISPTSTAPLKSFSSERFSILESSTVLPRIAPSRGSLGERIGPELQFYLDFHRKHISYHHFQWNYDCSDFISSYLVIEAQEFEPLLYALVALASYIYTVNHKPNGALQDFLPYYSKSLSLLRLHLESGNGNTQQFLITILTLAQFEEYLGDHVSLTAHQNAAKSIITSSYTSERMTESMYLTKILDWYLHFDLYMALLSGNETIHQRWFMAVHAFWDNLKKKHPGNPEYTIEERFSAIRVLAANLGNLTVRHRQAAPDDPSFKAETVALSRQVTAWYKDLDPPTFNIKQILEDPKAAPPTTPNNENIWPYCSIVMKFWACELIMKLQLSKIPNYSDEMGPELPDIGSLAIKLSRMYEAFQLHDPTPGAPIGMFSVIGPAGMILAKTPEGNMWYRRQLAATESRGLIFSKPFRERFTAILQSGPDWWLPNDELRTPVIKAVRQFVDDRINESKVQQERHKDLASLTGFFDKMNLNVPKE